MRICLISREYPPDTGFGGIATFTRHLVFGLVALGHDVEVISLAKDGAPDSLQYDQSVPIHRVVPLPVGANLGWTSKCMPYSRYVLRTTACLWHKFEELNSKEPFDVVDAPELLAEGFYPAITRAAPLLIRLYTPHSKFIAERLHNVTDTFDHQFVATMERVAMLSADVLTSPSEDLADFVSLDLNIDKNGIKIVRNPIDPAQFSPDGAIADIGDGGVKVLFVGRLEGRKGIHHLIEAVPSVVAQCPDVRFTIIGDDTNNGEGQKSVKAELVEMLKSSGSEPFVKFIARVPLTDLPLYYRAADISVVPSLYDNSPYTCLEAMSCGRPVIGTDGGGTKEYVVDGQSGVIVPAGDSSALAGAIVKLAADPVERHRLAKNARERVLAVFDRRQIAAETVQLYEGAIEEYRRRRGVKLYSGPTAHVLADADELFYSFDLMLRELILRRSLRARVKYWLELLLKRPRLFAARVAVGFLRAVGAGNSNALASLSQAVEAKERPRLFTRPRLAEPSGRPKADLEGEKLAPLSSSCRTHESNGRN